MEGTSCVNLSSDPGTSVVLAHCINCSNSCMASVDSEWGQRNEGRAPDITRSFSRTSRANGAMMPGCCHAFGRYSCIQ